MMKMKNGVGGDGGGSGGGGGFGLLLINVANLGSELISDLQFWIIISWFVLPAMPYILPSLVSNLIFFSNDGIP